MELFEAMENLPHNLVVADNFVKAYSHINSPKYKKIIATISGGADSDVLLDICYKCDKDKKIDYVWFDTGLEYQATKEHLCELEEKYGIKIIRTRPKKPVPVACKEYGQPFLNKRVALYISRLQKHKFDWRDGTYEELVKLWPKCESALRWWCNAWGEGSQFNITNNKWLKEFMLENPPAFKISNKCCDAAKKSIIHSLAKNYDLNIYGVRKAEGGQRATAYKSCFDDNYGECDEYRPIYWYSNSDKEEYCKACGVEHSRCYTEYGLPRTGCCGCPFGRDFEQELMMAELYEPQLYKAINVIFKESYDYTRRYKAFFEKKQAEEKDGYVQVSIFDLDNFKYVKNE